MKLTLVLNTILWYTKNRTVGCELWLIVHGHLQIVLICSCKFDMSLDNVFFSALHSSCLWNIYDLHGLRYVPQFPTYSVRCFSFCAGLEKH